MAHFHLILQVADRIVPTAHPCGMRCKNCLAQCCVVHGGKRFYTWHAVLACDYAFEEVAQSNQAAAFFAKPQKPAIYGGVQVTAHRCVCFADKVFFLFFGRCDVNNHAVLQVADRIVPTEHPCGMRCKNSRWTGKETTAWVAAVTRERISPDYSKVICDRARSTNALICSRVMPSNNSIASATLTLDTATRAWLFSGVSGRVSSSSRMMW